MKKVLVLMGFALVMGVASASATKPTLTENEEYFLNLDKEGQLVVLKSLYKQMKERDFYRKNQKDAFVEAFARVSELTAKNISKNKEVFFDAPGFTQRFAATKHFQEDKLTLRPSITYLLDFKEKILDVDRAFDKKNKDHSVFVYFDAIRNMVIIKNPDSKTAVIDAASITMEEIKDQVLLINPNFKF